MLKKTDRLIDEIVAQTHLPLTDLRLAAGQIKAKALFCADSIWFQGHFPVIRILPCVAVTALAVEPLLRYSRALGRPLKIVGFSKVRIKRLIFPEEELCIAIEEMPSDREAEVAFEVACRDEKICQGRAWVAEL
jgi:3-hydroxymyristoyl/3-hydroxydecanoyl-(acyl carrier protein) dehydratase